MNIDALIFRVNDHSLLFYRLLKQTQLDDHFQKKLYFRTPN